MSSNHTYTDAKLVGMNWDEDEVPDGYVDLTFRVPETGQDFHALMTADIAIKDNRMTRNGSRLMEQENQR